MIKTYVYEEGQPDEEALDFVEHKVTSVIPIPNAQEVFEVGQTVLINEKYGIACFLADDEKLAFYEDEVDLVLSTLTDENGNTQRVMAVDLYPLVGGIIQVEEV